MATSVSCGTLKLGNLINLRRNKRRKVIIMIKVLDRFTGKPIVPENQRIPTPGIYYSIVEDAYTQVIVPFYKKEEDSCFVVKYSLVNVKTHEVFEFTETYYPYGSDPRGNKFFSYISKHFTVPYGEDEALIGLSEKLEINWDVLGGFAYPIVSRRWFIDLPEAYKENYLNEDEDMEDED